MGEGTHLADLAVCIVCPWTSGVWSFYRGFFTFFSVLKGSSPVSGDAKRLGNSTENSDPSVCSWFTKLVFLFSFWQPFWTVIYEDIHLILFTWVWSLHFLDMGCANFDNEGPPTPGSCTQAPTSYSPVIPASMFGLHVGCYTHHESRSMHSDAATLEDRLNQLETMRWSSSWWISIKHRAIDVGEYCRVLKKLRGLETYCLNI